MREACESDLPHPTWTSSGAFDLGSLAPRKGTPTDCPDRALSQGVDRTVGARHYDFRSLLVANGWGETELTLCVVDDPAHGTHYEDKSCDQGGTDPVFDRTVDFFLSQWT